MYACSIIYKILDELSMKLVDAAPTIKEEEVVGRLEVLAQFEASVKKSESSSGKVAVAGCKVRLFSLGGPRDGQWAGRLTCREK
jgi:hypothetical protein